MERGRRDEKGGGVHPQNALEGDPREQQSSQQRQREAGQRTADERDGLPCPVDPEVTCSSPGTASVFCADIRSSALF